MKLPEFDHKLADGLAATDHPEIERVRVVGEPLAHTRVVAYNADGSEVHVMVAQVSGRDVPRAERFEIPTVIAR